MQVKEYLFENCLIETKEFFGIENQFYVHKIVEDWLNDASYPESRLGAIKKMTPSVKRILDMACGCGTFVFHGLLKNYDMYGIDPEEWKHELIKMKVEENLYPKEWLQRFYKGIGEELPFPESFFDCVTSWQTLEHVQNLEKCLAEMVRVVRNEGWIYIACPDYRRSFFEGHYKLPWLPLLSKRLARLYLFLLGKPVKGLETLNYVSQHEVIQIFRSLVKEKKINDFKIIDIHYLNFLNTGHKDDTTINRFIHSIRKFKHSCKVLFREEVSINLLIHISK